MPLGAFLQPPAAVLDQISGPMGARFLSSTGLGFLVSHYGAIGDTISCDAPCSAIGFRGKLLLRYPLVRSVFGLR